MNKTAKHSAMALLAATIGLCASLAQAQAVDRVYAIDGRGEVVMDPFGLCWRTGYWSPAAASTALAGDLPVGCACDKDIVPADKCTVKAAAAAPAPKPTADKVKLSADALFDFDKAVLKAEGKAKLDQLAAQAKSLKLEVILAVGHTDRLGSNAYNQRLSERRAAAVKTYLVSKGVDANRVYTEGKGETQPVTGNKCDKVGGRAAQISCLQPDRRVEVEVIGSK